MDGHDAKIPKRDPSSPVEKDDDATQEPEKEEEDEKSTATTNSQDKRDDDSSISGTPKVPVTAVETPSGLVMEVTSCTGDLSRQEDKNEPLLSNGRTPHTHRQARELCAVEDASNDETSTTTHEATISISETPGAFAVGGEDRDGTIADYSTMTITNTQQESTHTHLQAEGELESGNNSSDSGKQLVVAELAPETIAATAVPWRDSIVWQRAKVGLLVVVVIGIVVLITLLVTQDGVGQDPMDSTMPTLQPTRMVILRPTSRPTQTPTVAPTTLGPTTVFHASKLQQAISILSLYFPGLPASASHWSALQWLTDNDMGMLSGPGDPLEIVQRFVFAVIFYATGGNQWTSSNRWLSETSVCDWQGVQCQNGTAVEITLDGNFLSGTIPSELNRLEALTHLHLWDNFLVGTIPTEIRSLSKLEFLSLARNSLSGTIPVEVGELTALTYLNAWSNELVGSIPTEIFNLSRLKLLSMSSNLLSGFIPTELGELTALTDIDLFRNALGGPIPTEIGRLTSLTTLELQDNFLSGTMPTELSALSELKRIWLHNNRLSGSIPLVLVELFNALDPVYNGHESCNLGGNPRLMEVPNSCL